MPDDAVAIVRRFYDLVLNGDVEGGAALLHDELVIHEPIGLPYGGEFHGIAGWRECSEHEGRVVAHEIVGDIEYHPVGDDRVLMLVTTRFTGRATGRSTDQEVVEILRVRDGLIDVFDVYYKDPAAVAAVV